MDQLSSDLERRKFLARSIGASVGAVVAGAMMPELAAAAAQAIPQRTQRDDHDNNDDHDNKKRRKQPPQEVFSQAQLREIAESAGAIALASANEMEAVQAEAQGDPEVVLRILIRRLQERQVITDIDGTALLEMITALFHSVSVQNLLDRINEVRPQNAGFVGTALADVLLQTVNSVVATIPQEGDFSLGGLGKVPKVVGAALQGALTGFAIGGVPGAIIGGAVGGGCGAVEEFVID